MSLKLGARAVLCALMAVALPYQAQALDLTADFNRALGFDAAYQAALADRNAGLAGAAQAGAAYYPTLNLNNTRLPSDSSNRTTLSINQPLIDVANWSTMQQSEPRRAVAEANLLVKQQDLATRLLKAAHALITANENISLNKAKMDALNRQAERAKRLLEGGQGTITDLRDIDVKAAQARAQQLLLETQLGVAAKQYASITGQMPSTQDFVLPSQQGALQLKPLAAYADEAQQNNPQLLAVRASVQVSEWDVSRAKGAFAPTLSATHSKSINSATATAPKSSNTYTGLVLNMPLSAGTFYGVDSANANLQKLQEELRDAEQKTKVEVERLRALVASGLEVLAIQKDAIAAAELSVEANTKSYQGGVRSVVDVLNAIQTLYQVKSEYTTAVVQQSENLLALLHLTNANVPQVMSQSSRFLLAR